jgi:hypothetical protein
VLLISKGEQRNVLRLTTRFGGLFSFPLDKLELARLKPALYRLSLNADMSLQFLLMFLSPRNCTCDLCPEALLDLSPINCTSGDVMTGLHILTPMNCTSGEFGGVVSSLRRFSYMNSTSDFIYEK